MEYEVLLLLKAERDLNSLPVWLQDVVESHLVDLSQSPSAWARPVVSPPFPPGGMMFEFDHGPIGHTLHHIAVFFRYSQDETKIVVSGIGYTALRLPETES